MKNLIIKATKNKFSLFSCKIKENPLKNWFYSNSSEKNIGTSQNLIVLGRIVFEEKFVDQNGEQVRRLDVV